ncbi:MAG TPA: hypothetical protein VJG83_05890 [archaeon]|nr:hypothetical protein [archaeon]
MPSHPTDRAHRRGISSQKKNKRLKVQTYWRIPESGLAWNKIPTSALGFKSNFQDIKLQRVDATERRRSKGVIGRLKLSRRLTSGQRVKKAVRKKLVKTTEFGKPHFVVKVRKDPKRRESLTLTGSERTRFRHPDTLGKSHRVLRAISKNRKLFEELSEEDFDPREFPGRKKFRRHKR